MGGKGGAATRGHGSLSRGGCFASTFPPEHPVQMPNEIQEKFASSQDAFDDVVKYFGENPKTTPPSVFFPVFVRFVKAYKVYVKALLALISQASALLKMCLSPRSLQRPPSSCGQQIWVAFTR